MHTKDSKGKDPRPHLSKEELFAKMQKSSENVVGSLLKAVEKIPEDLPEEQKQLFRHILATAESLQEKLGHVIEDHLPPKTPQNKK